MNSEHQRLFALTETILNTMQRQSGPISFHDWMDAALYTPKLGYYESEEIFGKGGDFTTAVAMGPWLALSLAETIIKSWQAMGSPSHWTLIEQGGGSGDLLCNTLTALKSHDIFPDRIVEIEASAQLRERQKEKFSEHGFSVEQAATPDEVNTSEHAVFFSNELPDAFAVQAFIWKNKQLIERGVDWDGEKFIWSELEEIKSEHNSIPDTITSQWPEEYCSEINPHLSQWQQSISGLFDRGVVLTIDYGYTKQEYYRPQRIEGTLMGHYRHQVVDDVLKLSPGVCDITAHVDFSALKLAGEQVGLQSVAYTTQGAWLAQSQSVQKKIQHLATHPDIENIAAISHAKRLMLPTGMGESFKLLIQTKEVEHGEQLALPAFDRLGTL